MPLLPRSVAVRTARAFTYFVAFVLICFLLWINKYFGRPDLDQIAYHASLGSDGLLASDPVVIGRFVRWCVAGPLVFATIALGLEWRGVGQRLRQRLPSSARQLAGIIASHMPRLLLAVAVVYWVVDTSAVRFIGKNLGAGTDYRGFQLGYTFRLQDNLQLRLAYHDFEGAPNKTNSTQRFFFDFARYF